MLLDSSPKDESPSWAVGDIQRLRRFTGPPSEFWPAFLATAGGLIKAERGILILRNSSQPQKLRKLGEWTDAGPADRSAVEFHRLLPELTEKSVEHGCWNQPLANGAGSEPRPYSVAVCLPLPSAQEKCVAAFLLAGATDAQAREASVRLQLLADIPETYQVNQTLVQTKADVEKFASAMDVLVLVNSETRFLAAAMAFCNAIDTGFQCDRVSLGWLERGYVRLKSMSHTERFDKQMAAVQALEAAMEEALDQDNDVLWPAAEGSAVIHRDHQNFAREQNCGHICSLPLRLRDQPLAILTCERLAKPFTPIELQQLRLACDQVIRRLDDLKDQDRWFGARWADRCRVKLGALLGPQHTWAKVLALTGFAVLVLLLLPMFRYRVEGIFILRSEEVTFQTAPFDGYIQTVGVRPGDVVASRAPLLKLNTDELELEEAMALADQNRYVREAERARANKLLAEMRIAEALAEQAKAKLNSVRYRLGQATIAAPFNGVVVEGDLRQRIGAPVRKGEPLFKLARLESLYAEVEINERSVHEILHKGSGEIAFLTQPRTKFPITVTRLEPAAVPKEGQNVFLLRCALTPPHAPWWRPGMSGICKIQVEQRTLLWIATHRTVDFLRMQLWW